ncbi:FHA domain-containing protein [Glutamicibacter sp. JL.03c]|uniref:FHA domain-containing protein FhaB/FipA n=1 Tax=Glutamicibacter sp. JL.03c TaxID=2984842 RepID=UPI0021F7B9F2|nr:FHA domain-containing protein [Glutamicibacter sp. JL.03c]UYQ77634.1 FHA domain-containing protein [Glutamicibacter sp. JL.03c]
MNDLVLSLFRLGFLVLIWLLVLSVVGSMRRDLAVGSRARTGKPSKRALKKNPELAEPEAPARKAATSLAIVEGPLAGNSIPLSGQPIMFGRAQDATVVLDDDYASGRHARLFPQGSRWFIEDLGSTNGTFVGDSQLTRAQPVEPGQRIRIGKTVLELKA